MSARQILCQLVLLAILFTQTRLAAGADAAPGGSASEGPKYGLRYKFKSGDVIRTQVWHQVSLETTISGTTQTADTTSGSVKVWRIQEVDADGRVRLEHSVESVDMRQKLSDRQEVTYNSKTDKQPPPGYENVAKSVGVPLTVFIIDSSGNLLKRIDSRGNPPADAQNSQVTVPLPERPVARGESWNVPQDVTITLEDGETKVIKTRQHYTLDNVAKGVATISVVTQILTPVNNPKIQSQLVQRMTQGTIRFDMDAGRALSQKLELDERVLGFQGPESSLHYLGRFTEEYLPPEPKTASKAATKK
jgi:hypothetical protein